MDFIEGLPKSEGREVILLVVDRFTKYSHFVGINHPYTHFHVARIFMDNIYKLHGLPKSIISDRDSIFISAFWQELFKLLGTELSLSTAYHPQTDGQTERMNACLETYLSCMCGHKPKEWFKWLSLAEFWFNSHYHSRMKLTPFQALYGYQPPLQGYCENTTYFIASVEDYLQQRKLMSQLVKEGLEVAQDIMKTLADKGRNRTFEVRDWVYLNLQPYRQTTMAVRKNLKLTAKYYGPFKVLAKICNVAYKL